jgi:hypothetical protein
VLNIPGLEPEPKRDWVYLPTFLNAEQADWLYNRMLREPWSNHYSDGRDACEILYGPMYGKGGGQVTESVKHLVPEIPEFLQRLSARVSDKFNYLINAIQAHKYGPTCQVRPHHDPYGAIGMVAVGQERTFRVGGKMLPEYWKMSQSNREVSGHTPAEEILLQHGSILFFAGNNVCHSMFPATQDKQFNAPVIDGDPAETRITILFRYSTEAIRKYGPGKRANDAGHKTQYEEAQAAWRTLVENGGKK